MVSDRVQRQIDRLLDEAEAAITQSDWALARDRSQNVIALDTENADALAYLAAAGRALGTSSAPSSSSSVAASEPSSVLTSFAAATSGRPEFFSRIGL